MRLIRLTTTNTNGQIDTFFNENIHVKPFSQIALGNVSMDSKTDSLKIDGTNNEIDFQFRNSTPRTIFLELGTYTSSNYQVLLNDIEFKMNNILQTTGDAGERNKQVQVKVNNDGKVIIDVGNGGCAMYGANLEKNIYNNVGVPSLEITAAKKIISDTLATSTTSYGRATWYSNTLCKGGGIYRAKLENVKDTGEANNLQGGAIWAMESNPSTLKDGSLNVRPPAIADIKFGIRFEKHGDPYKMIINGVEMAVDDSRNVNIVNSGNSLNDVVAIEINGGLIQLVVYYNDGGATGRHILNDVNLIPYNSSSTDLWCGLSTMSKKTTQSNTRLSQINFTRNPFEAPVSETSNEEQLGLTPPIETIGAITPHVLQFISNSVASFLGYENSRIPVSGFITGATAQFIADNPFNATDTSDAFLIEMMNIPIESYDGLPAQGQRKNLLAIVPKSDIFEYVIYEPNNLLFLDMNNKQPLILNNIKARILKQDYSEMFIQGTTTLTIYIKDPNEK
tara:strand:- start:10286 stop:11806 length:1521 start_codon:yes stop_codon:yes gene_type:complete